MLNKSFFLCCFLLCSCAFLGRLIDPDLETIKKDRFLSSTGHEMLKILFKEDRLGYIYENDFFVKKVWGGNVVTQAIGQNIEINYTKNDFDKLKLLLGDDLSLGPELENIDYITLKLEDIKRHELVDFQPLIEYMGKDEMETLKKPFVVSMLNVSKFSVEAYQKTTGEFGAVYRPYPGITLKGSTGTSGKKEDKQTSYNVFIGYKLYDGYRWIDNFQNMPKVDIWILAPKNDEIVNRVRTRVKGSLPYYSTIEEDYKNKLSLYIMTQNEYQDDWILQSKVRIDTQGFFEGIVKLGELEQGNGHRYSIAVFATYFKINREVNSKIPFLPFNKGKFVINVKREDDF